MSHFNKPSNHNHISFDEGITHINQEVYGIIYGKGKVVTINKDCHYTFEVEYENSQRVPYTQEGYPAWIQTATPIRTVFLSKEIEDTNINIDKILQDSYKEIIKLRAENLLEYRKNHSSKWVNTALLNQEDIEDELEKALHTKELHMFRKALRPLV